MLSSNPRKGRCSAAIQRWTCAAGVFVALPLFGCREATSGSQPVVQPPRDSLRFRSATTDGSGIAQFPLDTVVVQVTDITSQQPIRNVNVVLLQVGRERAVVVIDTSSNYLPYGAMLEQLPEVSGSVSSPTSFKRTTGAKAARWITLRPSNLLTNVGSVALTLSENVLRYMQSTFFNCDSRGPLISTYTLTTQAAAQLVGRRLVLLTVGSFLSHSLPGLHPVYTAVATTLGVPSVTATTWNVLVHLFYLGQGYSLTDDFYVCTVRDQFTWLYDHTFLIYPVGAPGSAPARSAVVTGSVRDAHSGAAIGASIDLTGPSAAGVSSATGMFTFSALAAGTYNLSAWAPNYLPSAVSFVVPVGGTVQQDVVLRRPCPPVLPKVYAASVGGIPAGSGPPSDLYRVEVSDCGTDQRIGRIRTAAGEEPAIWDVALTPSGLLWGVGTDKLYLIDLLTAGVITEVPLNLPFGEVPLALASNSSNRLFAATHPGGLILEIERGTGSTSIRSSLGVGLSASGDLAFASSGELYATARDFSDVNTLLKVNLATGSATPIGSVTSIGFANVFGLAFVNNELFGFALDVAGGGNLIRIDTNTGAGRLVRRLTFQPGGAANVSSH